LSLPITISPPHPSDAQELPPPQSQEQFLKAADYLLSEFLGHNSASTLVRQVLTGLALEGGQIAQPLG